jgi:histone H3/H4
MTQAEQPDAFVVFISVTIVVLVAAALAMIIADIAKAAAEYAAKERRK